MPKIADTEAFCGMSALELDIGLQWSASYESISSVWVECSEQYVGVSIDGTRLFRDLSVSRRTVCYPTNGRLL
jgi:hypothetical protein